MLKKLALPLAALGLMSLIAAAPLAPKYRESFLPPNNLKHRIGALDSGGISEAQFNAVMDRMQAIYGPIVASHGATLQINRLWTDDTVNASAEEQGSTWILNMYGGLARDKNITQDGMALVACHEMGHHLGGAPKYGGGSDWAADEGEADYYANSKCLHRIFADAASASFTKAQTPGDDAALIAAACAKSYKGSKDRAVCVRASEAGLSTTALLAELGSDGPDHIGTPDPSVVAQTNDEHPASQCRLDTYFQGSLCGKAYTVDMSPTDPAVGGCVASQGYTSGMRPRCWYAPAAGELIGQSVASISASTEKQSHAASSAILASLKNGDVFSGL
ncbi:MAG TPA: hypothetical protein VH309_05045 [Elusimicrobiota bacterium]|jgi:hypothetical protein|nr:hypothetical protein [Elusimicrobiota bacterium]